MVAEQRDATLDLSPSTDAPAAIKQVVATTKPEAPRPANAASKILFLDGLRGIAAMFVVVEHSHWMGGMGQPAVDTFFVLSAFLLTMIFEKKARTLLAQKANARRWFWTLADYFVRRFLRVYPLFVIVAVVVWALPDAQKKIYFVNNPEHFNLWRVLTFQFDYRYHVFWTLPLEITYYFLIPVLVVGVLLLRRWWVLPLLPLGYLVAYSGFYWTRGDHMPLRPHLPTFLCGSMAAIVYAKAEQFISSRKFVFTWWSWGLLRAIEMVCVAMLFSCLFNGLVFDWVFKNPIKQTPGGRFVSSNVSVIIVAEMLLPGAIAAVLEWPLLRFAGKVSYSMYLLHSFVVYAPWITSQPFYNRFWAVWALTFLLSAASYHVVEYPCQLLAARIGQKIKQRDEAEKRPVYQPLPIVVESAGLNTSVQQ